MSFLVVGMQRMHPIRSPQDLGVLLRQARKLRGQSQRELAAEFGASQAWLSRVEQGYQKTWIGKVFRLGIDLTAGIPESSRDSKDSDRFTDYPDLNNLV